MESKFNETESTLGQLIMEKDKLRQSYNEEIKNIESSAKDHFKKIFNDHEKLKMLLVNQKRELELRGQELEKHETHNEHERKKLAEDLEKIVAKQHIELLKLRPGIQKMAKISVQNSIFSEYTLVVLLEIAEGKTTATSTNSKQEMFWKFMSQSLWWIC